MATLEGTPSHTPESRPPRRMSERERDLFLAESAELGGDSTGLADYLRQRAQDNELAPQFLSDVEIRDLLKGRRRLTKGQRPRRFMGRISLRRKPSTD